MDFNSVQAGPFQMLSFVPREIVARNSSKGHLNPLKSSRRARFNHQSTILQSVLQQYQSKRASYFHTSNCSDSLRKKIKPVDKSQSCLVKVCMQLWSSLLFKFPVNLLFIVNALSLDKSPVNLLFIVNHTRPAAPTLPASTPKTPATARAPPKT